MCYGISVHQRQALEGNHVSTTEENEKGLNFTHGMKLYKIELTTKLQKTRPKYLAIPSTLVANIG